MKIFQLVKKTGEYREIMGAGRLRPFIEASLLAQILDAFKLVNGADSEFLVFSKEEELQMRALSVQVLGGLQTDQGLGRVMAGTTLLLTKLLPPGRLRVVDIPADGDGNKLVSEVKDWLLAIGKVCDA